MLKSKADIPAWQPGVNIAKLFFSFSLLTRTNDTRRNCQFPKGQLTKKLSLHESQLAKTKPLGHSIYELTFWNLNFCLSIRQIS